MGIIYGLISMAVAYWFFNAAISVKKPAFKWAGIGWGVFMLCLFSGNMLVKEVQSGLQSADTEQLVKDGYTERKVFRQSSRYGSNEFSMMAVFNDLFPLILAVLVAAFMRAKLLLGVGFKESLRKSEVKEKLVDIGKKDQE